MAATTPQTASCYLAIAADTPHRMRWWCQCIASTTGNCLCCLHCYCLSCGHVPAAHCLTRAHTPLLLLLLLVWLQFDLALLLVVRLGLCRTS